MGPNRIWNLILMPCQQLWIKCLFYYYCYSKYIVNIYYRLHLPVEIFVYIEYVVVFRRFWVYHTDAGIHQYVLGDAFCENNSVWWLAENLTLECVCMWLMKEISDMHNEYIMYIYTITYYEQSYKQSIYSCAVFVNKYVFYMDGYMEHEYAQPTHVCIPWCILHIQITT